MEWIGGPSMWTRQLAVLLLLFVFSAFGSIPPSPIPHASAFPISFSGSTGVTDGGEGVLANTSSFTTQTLTTIESATSGFEGVIGGFKSGVALLDAVVNDGASVTSSGVAFAQASGIGALPPGGGSVHVFSAFSLSFAPTDRPVALDLIVTAHREGVHGALNAVFAGFTSPTEGLLLSFVRPGIPLDETRELHALLPPVDAGEYVFGVMSFARAVAQPTPAFSLTRIEWKLSIREVAAPWSLAMVLVGFGLVTALSVRRRRVETPRSSCKASRHTTVHHGDRADS